MGMAMLVAVPMACMVVIMRIVVPVAIVLPMGLLVAMVLVLVLATMIVLFHRPHLTSVAQMSAYVAIAANMGASGRITKGGM
jgi:hypothetical protein